MFWACCIPWELSTLTSLNSTIFVWHTYYFIMALWLAGNFIQICWIQICTTISGHMYFHYQLVLRFLDVIFYYVVYLQLVAEYVESEHCPCCAWGSEARYRLKHRLRIRRSTEGSKHCPLCLDATLCHPQLPTQWPRSVIFFFLTCTVWIFLLSN